MILTCHLLAGAAIASKISNPAWALPLAFLNHYFLDALPHKDYSIANIHQKQWNKAFFDFLKVFIDVFSGFLLISLFADNNMIIFYAAFLTIAPDGVTLLSKIIPENKIMYLHQKIHMAVNTIGDSEINKKIPCFLGILSQIIVISAAIYFLR